MKKICRQKGNPNELLPIKVFGGYDVLIPKTYNNSYYFLKCGCPIWIKLEDEYDVLEIERTTTWGKETIEYISSNLPEIEPPYFRNVDSQDNAVADENRMYLIKDLSVRQYDFNGEVTLEIQAFDRQSPPETIEDLDGKGIPIPTIEVAFIKTGRSFQNKLFIDNILKGNNANPYRGKVMWCKLNRYHECYKSFGFEDHPNGIAIRNIN